MNLPTCNPRRRIKKKTFWSWAVARPKETAKRVVLTKRARVQHPRWNYAFESLDPTEAVEDADEAVVDVTDEEAADVVATVVVKADEEADVVAKDEEEVAGKDAAVDVDADEAVVEVVAT